MQVAEVQLLIVAEEQLELQIELEHRLIVMQVLQEVVVLTIDQQEEQTVREQHLAAVQDLLIVERLDQRLEVQEVLQHQAEALDQLDLTRLQVEVQIEVATHQVEVLREALLAEVFLQAEVLAEALLQVEVLLQAEVAALAEVLLEETNKKVDFKLFFQNQLLSLTL